MYSKVGQSNQSYQKVGTSNTKNIKHVGQMATQNKPINKSVQPNIEEQTEKYHKKINREIKDIVKNDVNYHNEFLLMLIEIAVANKNVDIVIPKDCINETKK